MTALLLDPGRCASDGIRGDAESVLETLPVSAASALLGHVCIDIVVVHHVVGFFFDRLIAFRATVAFT